MLVELLFVWKSEFWTWLTRIFLFFCREMSKFRKFLVNFNWKYLNSFFSMVGALTILFVCFHSVVKWRAYVELLVIQTIKIGKGLIKEFLPFKHIEFGFQLIERYWRQIITTGYQLKRPIILNVLWEFSHYSRVHVSGQLYFISA